MKYYKGIFYLYIVMLMVSHGLYSSGWNAGNVVMKTSAICLCAFVSVLYIIYRVKTFKCFNMSVRRMIVELVVQLSGAVIILFMNKNYLILLPFIVCCIPTVINNDYIDEFYKSKK
ncbi:MAG: hypothetical protein NC122_08070 [Faecalibacterium sp.]|nr:hypothetical protein [Ruminococcus sp.]MCM1486150.1 hypothetical protein [Faecalibacterium sp.]